MDGFLPSKKANRPLKYILIPLGLAFHFAACLRNLIYNLRLIKIKSLPRPVISIGNITFGGTGKTPFTIYLANLLKDKSYKPCILIRGYKRKEEIIMEANSDEDYKSVGDEAVLLSKNLKGIPVIVGKGRFKAGLFALSKHPEITHFILDDGFQYRGLKRDLDIVLIDGNQPSDLKIPPIGRLREPLSSLKRANLIGIQGDNELPFLNSSTIQPFHFYKKWNGFKNMNGESIEKLPENKKPLILLGIGSPESFIKILTEYGLINFSTLILRDHQIMTKHIILEIKSLVQSNNIDYILTSEKDFCRWSSNLSLMSLPIFYPLLSIDISLTDRIINKMETL